MKRPYLFAALAVLFAGIFAVIVPVAMMLAGMALSMHGYAALGLTVFFSFVVAGGLMFLIFYSARQGFDDAAHQSMRKGPHDDPSMH